MLCLKFCSLFKLPYELDLSNSQISAVSLKNFLRSPTGENSHELAEILFPLVVVASQRDPALDLSQPQALSRLPDDDCRRFVIVQTQSVLIRPSMRLRSLPSVFFISFHDHLFFLIFLLSFSS